MENIDAAAEALVDQLTSAGFNAAIDPRNLRLPGVWVALVEVDFERLDDDAYTAEFDFYLIARDTGTRPALRTLSRMLTKLRGLVPVPTAEALTVGLPNHAPDGLPALRVPVTTEVTKE